MSFINLKRALIPFATAALPLLGSAAAAQEADCAQGIDVRAVATEVARMTADQVNPAYFSALNDETRSQIIEFAGRLIDQQKNQVTRTLQQMANQREAGRDVGRSMEQFVARFPAFIELAAQVSSGELNKNDVALTVSNTVDASRTELFNAIDSASGAEPFCIRKPAGVEAPAAASPG